jgi:cell pole-organizing protein PopZ
MEEILASIRRIIADDQALPRPPRAVEPSPLEVHRPAIAPVKLAHPAKAPDPDPRDYDPSDEGLDLADHVDRLTEPTAASVAAEGDEGVPDHGQDQLISPAASASVSSAFETLATSMILQNTGMIEGAVRDLLRPMLKGWLDDNLPTIVERLVRAEIERVARGRRG